MNIIKYVYDEVAARGIWFVCGIVLAIIGLISPAIAEAAVIAAANAAEEDE